MPTLQLFHPYTSCKQCRLKNGARRSADTRKTNTISMIEYAKAMTDDEIQATADYFAAIPFTSRVTVIESKTAPKTRLVAARYFPT